jgi:hypothetical protein
VDLNAPVQTLFASTTSNTATGQSYTIGSGGTAFNDTSNTAVNYIWPYYEPYKTYYYPIYHEIPASDKFEVAFKLSRKLMELKLTRPLKTIEDYFKLMDAIVAVL